MNIVRLNGESQTLNVKVSSSIADILIADRNGWIHHEN